MNRAPLTITALGNSKTYDSTVTAAALPAVSGLLGADTVTGLAEVYTDINAGTAKTLNVARYTVNDGNGGMNYLVSTSANATGLINRASLTITATTNTKTYDSTTTAAAIPVVSGLMGADSVSGIAEAYRVVNAIPAVTTLTGLKSPFSLAVDAAGNLYAANYGAGTISVFAPGATAPTTTLTGLNSPFASIVFDKTGNLYVSNYGGNTVSVFAPGATTPTGTLTELNSPQNLAFDAVGNLYVTNFLTNGTVSVFAPGISTPTVTLTGLDQPNGLVFDPSGNLYVSNWAMGTISEFAGCHDPRGDDQRVRTNRFHVNGCHWQAVRCLRQQGQHLSPWSHDAQRHAHRYIIGARHGAG